MPTIIVRGLLLAMLAAGLCSAQQTSDQEKQLRADFKHAMLSKDPSLRVAAVASYDAATRLLEEGGGNRLVARTLASALEDEDLSVAAAAVAALSWGRDPGTVIESFDNAFENWRKLLERTATRPDEASRDRYRATVATYLAGTRALANYADDRSVKVFQDELTVLRPGGILENTAASLLGPVCSALLALGSRSAVESVVKATATFPAESFGGTSEQERSTLGMANAIHRALVDFSVGLEVPAPEFSQNYQQDWAHWFKQQKKRFQSKLGKLKEPPGPPVSARERAARRAAKGRSRRP